MRTWGVQAPGPAGVLRLEGTGGGVTPFSRHHEPGCPRRGMPLEGSSWSGIGGRGGSSGVRLGGNSSASFSSGHADRPHLLGVEELAYDGLLGGEQLLTGTEHRQVPR